MVATPIRLTHAQRLPTALLSRISQESVRQGDSLEHQVMALKEWARQKSNDGVQYVIKEKHIFQDDGVSAWSTAILQRPAIQKLTKAIEDGEIKVVMIKGLSRFNRDDVDARQFFDWMDGRGVRLLSLEEGFDSAERGSATSIFMVHSMLSRMESDRKSVSIKVAMRQKARKGEYTGGIPSYGYEWDGKAKKLRPIERLKPMIQDMFELAGQGWGGVKIAHHFNETKKWHHLDAKQWSPNLIKRILARPVYVGDMQQQVIEQRYTRTLDYSVDGGRVFGKKKRIEEKRPEDEVVVVKDTHDKIISRELFDKVQELTKQRAKPGSRTYQPNAKHPLTGILTCGSCGGPMIHHGRNKEKGYNYYSCSIKFRRGVAFCNQENVRADKLHELVLLNLEERMEQLRNDEGFWSRFRANDGSGPALARRLADVEGQITTAEEKLAQMFIEQDDIRSSVFERATKAIEQKIQTFEAERNRIQGELTALRSGNEAADSLLTDIDDLFRKGFKYDLDDRAGLRTLFHKWVANITLNNDGHGGGYKETGRKKRVEIDWKVDQMLKESSN